MLSTQHCGHDSQRAAIPAACTLTHRAAGVTGYVSNVPALPTPLVAPPPRTHTAAMHSARTLSSAAELAVGAGSLLEVLLALFPPRLRLATLHAAVWQ